jgi:hypothetical protein
MNGWKFQPRLLITSEKRGGAITRNRQYLKSHQLRMDLFPPSQSIDTRTEQYHEILMRLLGKLQNSCWVVGVLRLLEMQKLTKKNRFMRKGKLKFPMKMNAVNNRQSSKFCQTSLQMKTSL